MSLLSVEGRVEGYRENVGEAGREGQGSLTVSTLSGGPVVNQLL